MRPTHLQLVMMGVECDQSGLVMQNATLIPIEAQPEQQEPVCAFPGGVCGFVFYWLAFTVPFIFHGSNTLFFLLYTWPFFLVLMPVSVLLGIAFSMLLPGRWLPMLLLTGGSVLSLFWLVFSFLSVW